MKEYPIKWIKPLTQTQKLNAWLAVPGNKDKTAAQYAQHLKDNTVIQGEMK